MVPRAATAGAVPDQTDDVRYRARRFTHRQRYIGMKISFAVKHLRGDLRNAAGSDCHVHHATSCEIVSVGLRAKSAVGAAERESAEGVRCAQRRN